MRVSLSFFLTVVLGLPCITAASPVVVTDSRITILQTFAYTQGGNASQVFQQNLAASGERTWPRSSSSTFGTASATVNNHYATNVSPDGFTIFGSARAENRNAIGGASLTAQFQLLVDFHVTTPSTGAISFDGIATLSNPGPGYQNGITENSARTRMSVSDIGSSPVSVIWAREVNLGSFDKNPSATAIELVPGKTYRLLISMSIDGNNWSGNYTLETRFNNTGLMITPNPDTGGFAGWAVLEDLPPERRGPLDTNGPLALPNLLAFAMGLNPLTATAVDLPRASPINTQSETVSFRYRRAKNAPGISLKPLVSADFISWQDVSGGDVAVLADDGEAELVELTLPNPAEGLLFLRLEAEEIP